MKKRIIKNLILLILVLIFFSFNTFAKNEPETERETEAWENSVYARFATPSEIGCKYITINFMGDIFPAKKVKDAYDKKGVDGIIGEDYLDLLKKSDFNVANLECPVSNLEVPNEEANKTYTFVLPTKYGNIFNDIKIGLFSMANNHMLDFGNEVANDTMKILDRLGIKHIGYGKNIDEASKPYIKEINGQKIAFIAASSVLPKDKWKATKNSEGISNGYDVASICTLIKNTKKIADRVIVYMHWGKELENYSNTIQKTNAHRFVDSGADLVVGSHPHVLQEIEYYKETPIVYSLGNFIYGGTVKETMMLEVTFLYTDTDPGYLSLRVIPGISNYEKVNTCWRKEEIVLRNQILQLKSPTCKIDDEGKIYSFEQVEFMENDARRKASESEAARLREEEEKKKEQLKTKEKK